MSGAWTFAMKIRLADSQALFGFQKIRLSRLELVESLPFGLQMTICGSSLHHFFIQE